MVEAATHTTPRIEVPEERVGTHLRPAAIDWGAVLAGAVTAIAIQFFFSVLGLAIGVSVAPATAATTATTAVDVTSFVRPISAAAGFWWLITGTIALAIGGAVLGRLWRAERGPSLFIHAVALWGAVAIFGFLVIWSGAAISSNAVTPMSAVRDRDYATGQQLDRTWTADERALVAERVRRAVRTASWWSTFGLLLGVSATVIAALASAPEQIDPRTGPSPYWTPPH